jgi:hypothetical protein
MVTPIEIGPAHRIRFPESSDIVSAVFSQDGSSLFVHIKPTTINIWHVIVDRWEIVLGVVVGLLLLACGVRIIRILMRRRRPGSVYCARCNYCLDGQRGIGEADSCPECGRDLGARRVIRGRSTRRRLMGSVVVGVIAIGLYATLQVTGMPRQAAFWFEWHSERLADWSSNVSWLKRYRGEHDRIVEVDPVGGTTRRVLTTQSTTGFWAMALSADGRSLLLPSFDRSRRETIVRIDVQSGRVRARTRLPGHGGDTRYGLILGEVGGRVIFNVVDRDASKQIFGALDLSDGSIEILREQDARLRPGNGPDGTPAVIASEDPLVVVMAPTFMRQGEAYVLEIVDVDHNAVQSFEPTPQPDIDALPTIDPSTGFVFLESHTSGLLGFDLATGEHVGALAQDGLASSGVIHRGRRWLVLTTYSDSMRIRDIAHRAWVATLPYPDDLIGPDPVMSADSRRLAAIGFLDPSTMQTPVPPISELLLYDLSPLDAPADTPDSP